MLVWKETKNGWVDWAWSPCITNENNEGLNFVVAYRQSTYGDVGECKYEDNVPDDFEDNHAAYWRVVYIAQPCADDFFLISEYDEDKLRETLEMKAKLLGLEELGIERLRHMEVLKGA
jgi:hypothetical protein